MAPFVDISGTELEYNTQALNCSAVSPFSSFFLFQVPHPPYPVRHSSSLPSPGNGRRASVRTTQTIRRGRTRAWKPVGAPGRSNNDSRRRGPRRCVSRATCSRDVHQRDRDGHHHRVLCAFSSTFGERENAYQGLGVFPHLRGHVRDVYSLCLVAFLFCILTHT